jgi:flagellar hook assembly protein FlgD
MVDLKGNGINGPIELEFEGGLKIEGNILSDWSGHGISATINMMPDKVTLNTAYPNPFNPVTSINYTLSGMDHVTLSVYNLMGQVIETLVDGQQDAGSYTLVWDAAQLPSGMYFLRMETGNEMFHQKLMLLK